MPDVLELAGGTGYLILLHFDALNSNLYAGRDLAGMFERQAQLVNFGQQILKRLRIGRRILRPSSATDTQE